MLERRKLFVGLLAAPFVVRSGILMAVKTIPEELLRATENHKIFNPPDDWIQIGDGKWEMKYTVHRSPGGIIILKATS